MVSDALNTSTFKVLVVDDDTSVRNLLARILSIYGHRAECAAGAGEARRMLGHGDWDVVLCDVRMPEESGISLLNHIRSQYPALPVVMVSGVDDPDSASVAIEAGAYGYVIKPFEANQVVIAIVNAVQRARLEAENRVYREHLERMVSERTAALETAIADLRRSDEQLRAASLDTIAALSRAIEGRDVETGQHIERMSGYAAVIARHYGLAEEHCRLIRLASPMHDVGKIGVPDGILFKPGKLSTGEYEVIKQHPELGYSILAKSDQPLLQVAAEIARTHHERWDGTGYAQGLAGEAIPVEGRIASVADVFDALMSRRVYKPAFTVERSLDIMREGRGTQFDGEIIDVLMENIDEVLAIYEMYADSQG